jgi:hypothetical protein
MLSKQDICSWATDWKRSILVTQKNISTMILTKLKRNAILFCHFPCFDLPQIYIKLESISCIYDGCILLLIFFIIQLSMLYSQKQVSVGEKKPCNLAWLWVSRPKKLIKTLCLSIFHIWQHEYFWMYIDI